MNYGEMRAVCCFSQVALSRRSRAGASARQALPTADQARETFVGNQTQEVLAVFLKL